MFKKISRMLRGKPAPITLPDYAERVLSERLTYLSRPKLLALIEVVDRLEAESIEGRIIEAGCALGGSAIVLAHTKDAARELFVYDVFGMIPPPGERDGEDVHERYETISSGNSRGLGDDTYYGYEENLFDKVAQNFTRHGVPVEDHNVHMVKGLFQDTIEVDSPVALAHIDGDWYDSVMTCLERIEPHLAVGGVLAIDDYYDWSGCRSAVDDYFADKRERFHFTDATPLHITRIS